MDNNEQYPQYDNGQYYQDTTGELNVSISGSGQFTIWGIGLIK